MAKRVNFHSGILNPAVRLRQRGEFLKHSDADLEVFLYLLNVMALCCSVQITQRNVIFMGQLTVHILYKIKLVNIILNAIP